MSPTSPDTSRKPFGVDTASGVKSAPGVKDLAKVRAFVHAVREEDSPLLPCPHRAKLRKIVQPLHPTEASEDDPCDTAPLAGCSCCSLSRCWPTSAVSSALSPLPPQTVMHW
ncbi:MAG TPA: hypothetical protein DDY54_00070 [Deltaproteobacteria bacterium]|nr:hypothetical protein [Deltaproteobacteria bacterium]